MGDWNSISVDNVPKQGRDILFTTDYDIVYAGHWMDIIRDNPTEEEKLGDIIDGFHPLFYMTNAKAVAWMYYPEPYKKQSEL